MPITAILSSLIFLVSLGLIFSERINRTIVGIAGAALMVGAGRLLGFYSEAQAVDAVDFNTLGLLLGMMILVALLEPTGFFQYLAVWAGRVSKGHPVRLLVLLGTVTTVVSMFLDNVTTVILIAPVTILICEILGISPAPFLLGEALLSDTGGVATLVGDPPNILIGSAAGLSFVDFLVYSLPIVLVAWLTALILLCYLFRHELAVRPQNMEAVLQLNPTEALEDRRTAQRVLIVLGAAILLFFVSHFLRISPAFIALSAAGAALVWVRPDMKKMLEGIEWSVLLFFAGLFVMVGGLEAAGVFASLVRVLEGATSIFTCVVWRGPHLGGGGPVRDRGQHSCHDCHDPSHPEARCGRHGDRAPVVGVGLRLRFWRQRHHRWVIRQHRRCHPLRKDALADHAENVEQARPAGHAGHLCSRQHPVCPGLSLAHPLKERS